jgi:hypothetical protein
MNYSTTMPTTRRIASCRTNADNVLRVILHRNQHFQQLVETSLFPLWLYRDERSNLKGLQLSLRCRFESRSHNRADPIDFVSRGMLVGLIVGISLPLLIRRPFTLFVFVPGGVLAGGVMGGLIGQVCRILARRAHRREYEKTSQAK